MQYVSTQKELQKFEVTSVCVAKLIKVCCKLLFEFSIGGYQLLSLKEAWLCLNAWCLLPINLLTALIDSILCLINPSEIVLLLIREY